MTGGIRIPRERVQVRYARSGGPGGQNVNKVETKAEVRFVVSEADWIPEHVREKLVERYANRITAGGELVVTSSRNRTRAQNLEDCFEKLESMLAAAARRERPRVPTAPTRGSQVRRKETKRRKSVLKRDRRYRADE
jgi:ribosome-associated protein